MDRLNRGTDASKMDEMTGGEKVQVSTPDDTTKGCPHHHLHVPVLAFGVVRTDDQLIIELCLVN